MKICSAVWVSLISVGVAANAFAIGADELRYQTSERQQGQSPADVADGRGQASLPLSVPTGRYDDNKPVSQSLNSDEVMGAVLQPQYLSRDGSINHKDNPDAKGMGTGFNQRQDGTFDVMLRNVPWQALDSKVQDAVTSKLESSKNPADQKQLEAIKAGGQGVVVSADVNVKQGANSQPMIALTGRTDVLVKTPTVTQPAAQNPAALAQTQPTKESPAAATPPTAQAASQPAGKISGVLESVVRALPAGVAAPVMGLLNKIVSNPAPMANAGQVSGLNVNTSVKAGAPSAVVMNFLYAPAVFSGPTLHDGNLTANAAAQAGITVMPGIDSTHFHIMSPVNQFSPQMQHEILNKLNSAPTFDESSHMMASEIQKNPTMLVGLNVDVHSYADREATIAPSDIHPVKVMQDPFFVSR